MAGREGGRTARISKETVDAASKEATRYTLWDAKLKGFGLRVEPSGSKTYLVRYRVGGGRSGTLRQYKIGSASAMTPTQARSAAEGVLALAAIGQDPQRARAETRKIPTVSALCETYMAEGVATKKASTLALDRIRIDGHIKPLIGSRRLDELNTGDIERMMNAIAAGRVKAVAGDELKPGSRVRGGKAAATKTVKLLRAIFNFALSRKLCAENPCLGVKTFPDGKRERFLSDAEMGRLGDVLAAALAGGTDPHHVTIIRLLALTGARKNEIARLRWSEVQDGYLQLDDSKTGRKVIPLGAAAQELLQGVARTKSPWVFPDPRDARLPIRNLDWFWVGVRKRAELPEVRIHDLRHSFASKGAAGGAPLLLLGKLLGHSHAATTQRYAHLSDDPAKAAADKISSAISAAMSGSGGELKPMRSGS